MRDKINLALINRLNKEHKLKAPAARYEIRDTELKGFTLRVEKSGKLSYYMVCARSERKHIGTADTMEPGTARSIAETHRAQQAMAKAGFGETPKEEERRKRDEARKAKADAIANQEAAKVEAKSVYLTFIEDTYRPYLVGHLRGGIDNAESVRETMANLKNRFTEFHHLLLSEITLQSIDTWRQTRIANGKSPATVNRQLNDLSACLSKAVLWGLLESSPFEKLKPMKTDLSKIARFLSKDEEKRLRAALDKREAALKEARVNANKWRADRGYAEYSDLSVSSFADHLKPSVILSLNTGLRLSELLSLKWSAINLERRTLTVFGSTAKSGKTRHVQLNDEAVAVLTQWKHQPGIKSIWVFPGSNGKPMQSVRTSWESLLKSAEIEGFRWHDLRHTFASNLVMAGVDLNTVRELLGHSDYKMTQRYAHLAPEHKQEAVDKLMMIKIG